jgi:hypothetical protein
MGILGETSKIEVSVSKNPGNTVQTVGWEVLYGL